MNPTISLCAFVLTPFVVALSPGKAPHGISLIVPLRDGSIYRYHVSMKLQRLFVPLLLLLAACSSIDSNDVAELPTRVVLPSLTPSSTATLTPTPTATPISTATATHTATPSATVTLTPSETITDTPTPTVTDTPTPRPSPTVTPDDDAIFELAALAAVFTPVPQNIQLQQPLTGVGSGGTVAASVPVTCAASPPGNFGVIFNSDATLSGQLGCPQGQPPVAVSLASASQLFERGGMFWLDGQPGQIYVLLSTGRFQRFDDNFNPGLDPHNGGETPPDGLLEPVRGFGKVWRENPSVRGNLGWATVAEQGATASIVLFERGRMVSLPQRGETLIIIEDPGGITGTWRAVPGTS